MSISANKIFTKVRTAVLASYTGAFVTSEKLYAPSIFPCLELVEIDTYPDPSGINLCMTDTQRRSVFEAQAYSNLTSGANAEAKAIIEIVTTTLKGLGYRCTTQTPVPNASDTSIKRYVARYTRVIGDGESLSS